MFLFLYFFFFLNFFFFFFFVFFKGLKFPSCLPAAKLRNGSNKNRTRRRTRRKQNVDQRGVWQSINQLERGRRRRKKTRNGRSSIDFRCRETDNIKTEKRTEPVREKSTIVFHSVAESYRPHRPTISIESLASPKERRSRYAKNVSTNLWFVLDRLR